MSVDPMATSLLTQFGPVGGIFLYLFVKDGLRWHGKRNGNGNVTKSFCDERNSNIKDQLGHTHDQLDRIEDKLDRYLERE